MNWVAILVASIGLCGGEPIAAQDSRRQLRPACVASDPNRSFETEDVQLDVEAFARALGRRDPLSRHDFFLLLGPESPFEEELERAVCRSRTLQAPADLNSPADAACEDWITARSRENSASIFFLLLERASEGCSWTSPACTPQLQKQGSFWQISFWSQAGQKVLELRHPSTPGGTDLYLLSPVALGDRPIEEVVERWLREIESGEALPALVPTPRPLLPRAVPRE